MAAFDEADGAQWLRVPHVDNVPAVVMLRAATRAAPKERAMATIVRVLTAGVEMSWG